MGVDVGSAAEGRPPSGPESEAMRARREELSELTLDDLRALLQATQQKVRGEASIEIPAEPRVQMYGM
jgi:hypothetical protein